MPSISITLQMYKLLMDAAPIAATSFLLYLLFFANLLGVLRLRGGWPGKLFSNTEYKYQKGHLWMAFSGLKHAK